MPMIRPRTIAAAVNSRVWGRAVLIWFQTGWLVLSESPRSPRARSPRKTRYCFQSGSFRPICSRSDSTACWEALSPRTAVAGSPGATRTMMKMTVKTARSVGMARRRRRRMCLSIGKGKGQRATMTGYWIRWMRGSGTHLKAAGSPFPPSETGVRGLSLRRRDRRGLVDPRVEGPDRDQLVPVVDAGVPGVDLVAVLERDGGHVGQDLGVGLPPELV